MYQIQENEKLYAMVKKPLTPNALRTVSFILKHWHLLLFCKIGWSVKCGIVTKKRIQNSCSFYCKNKTFSRVHRAKLDSAWNWYFGIFGWLRIAYHRKEIGTEIGTDQPLVSLLGRGGLTKMNVQTQLIFIIVKF